MKLQNIVMLLLLVTTLVGCAAPATMNFKHSPAASTKIKNSVVINKPFEQAWNDMVKRMTVSQYRINNIEKASRIINLEYQIENPADVEKYIDCGINHRLIDYDGKPRSFDYSVANSKKYEVVLHNKYYYWYDVSPRSTLSGTVNVYMSPVNDRQTEISVNARYKVRRTFSGEYYTQRNSGKYLRNGTFKWDPVSFTLTTKEPGIYPSNANPAVRCYSKGTIEAQFLSYAKN